MALNDQTYDWLIAQTSSGTFDTSKLSLSVSGFTQPFYKFALVDGTHAAGITGGTANQLYVQCYSAVPEATTLLLGMAGLAPILMQRRGRHWFLVQAQPFRSPLRRRVDCGHSHQLRLQRHHQLGRWGQHPMGGLLREAPANTTSRGNHTLHGRR